MLTSNPSLRNKSLRARNKIPHVELLRGDARLVPRYAMTATYGNRKRSIQKRFSVFRKKRAVPRNYFITTFGKSLFITQYLMRYTIYMPPNTKDLTIDLTMLAYGNRQNAIKLARANNLDLLRALNHLTEIRPYIHEIFSVFEL